MSTHTTISSSLSSYYTNQSFLSQGHEEEKRSSINQRVTHAAQEIFQSPLAYYGNRNTDQADFFQLIQLKAKEKGRFRCFYDLFAGSGSASLYAMSLKMADSYHINDLFSPLKQFWKSVRDNPEELIQQYDLYLDDYLKAPDRNLYFTKLKELFNHTERDNSALFAFIINHAESGKPILSKVGEDFAIMCKMVSQVGELEIDKVFADRVRKVNQLFEINDVVFSSKNYHTFLGMIDGDDFVMMDPPNPDLPDGDEAPKAHLYQRSVSKSILTEQLLTAVNLLNERNVAYLMFYGVLGLDSPYQLKHPAGHIYRLSRSFDRECIEHTYLSQSLIPHLLYNSELPDSLQPCFHRIFETQALINGDKHALSWYESGRQRVLSYSVLNQTSNKLARRLLGEGLEKDLVEKNDPKKAGNSLVAICLERTPALIMSMLAVMKSGAAYIPFDANPDSISRDACLQNMAQAKVKYLLTSPTILKELREVRDSSSLLESMTIIPFKDSLCREATQVIVDGSNLNRLIGRTDLVYVMNTSGSSGRPKGVKIAQWGLPYAFSSHQNLLNIKTTDRIAQFGSVGFDASLMEIMIALGSGATLSLVTKDIYTDDRLLTSYLTDQKISIAIQTPKMLAQLDPAKLPNLRKIFIVGDKFTEALSNKWIHTEENNLIIERQVINGYGLTETTICTTLEECSLQKKLSIGKAILGLEVYLREKEEEIKQEVSLANAKWLSPPKDKKEFKPVEGVIYASGPCVSQGYWQLDELTAKVFQTVIINSQNKRLYNTGDVGYYLSNGSLVITGRIGRQVKIRGQRIELDSVEEIAKEMKELVTDARAIAKESGFDQEGTIENQLALYMVPRNPAWVIEDRQASDESLKQLIAIRNYIRAKTHSSMVPALNCMKFVREITYKDNDKKSCNDAILLKFDLPCIDTKPEKEADLIGLSQPVIQLLGWVRDVLGEVLKIKPETISFSEHTMNDLGADSITIFRCIRALDKRANEKPQYKEEIHSITAPVLRHSTLYQLGVHLQNRRHEIDRANEQKTHEEKTYGVGTQKRVLTSTFNLGEESFYNKISIPFYVVHSLLGDAETDYDASVIKKIACTYEKLNTPSIDLMTSWGREKFFDQLAEHHIAEIKKTEGPLQQVFWLLGWSSGGIVALKIAEKLRNEGKEVYLFLLDPTHPSGIQQMSLERHAEIMIDLGNKLLSLAGRYAEYSGELKVDCMDELDAIANREEQAKFLFEHLNHKIEMLKGDSQSPLYNQVSRFIDKMVTSAKMIYLAELAMDDNFTFSGKHDRVFFAKDSDAKYDWQIDPIVQQVEIDGDHFKIVNSDQLKNEINGALHKQFKQINNDVFKGIAKFNICSYSEAAECFERAVRKNPGDMRAQLSFIKSKLMLNEYDTVLDHISKLLTKIGSNGSADNLMVFIKMLKSFANVAKNLRENEKKANMMMQLSQSDMARMTLDDIESLSSGPKNRNQSKKIPCLFDSLLRSSHLWQERMRSTPDEFSLFRNNYKMKLIDMLNHDLSIFELLQFSNILGKNALLEDEYVQAITHFTHAVTKPKPSPFAYAGRACAYYFLGDKQSAIRDLNEGIKTAPEHFGLHAIRGMIYLLSNQFMMAQSDLKKAALLIPDAFIIRKLIQAYRTSNLEEAMYWANYYVDHFSKDYQGYALKAAIHFDKQEFEDAEKAITVSIKINPNGPELYAERIKIHLLRNNLEAIIQDATAAIRLKPNHFEAFLMRGYAILGMGKFDESINDFKQCLLIKPGDGRATMLLQIVETYKKSGPSTEGMAVFREVGKQMVSHLNSPNKMPNVSDMNFRDRMFDAMVNDLQQKEFSTFEKSFTIIPTEADGACGLHALLGKISNKRLFFEGAKTKYVEAFNRHFNRVAMMWENCMLGMLKEYFGPTGGSTDVKIIFNQIPEVIWLLRNALDSLEAQRKRFLSEQAEVFEQLRDDETFQTVQMKLAKIQEEREALLKSYIQFPLFREIYMKACLNRSYYFADNEIGIAAHLFNKKVQIFSHSSNGVVGPIEYGQGDETIVIYHKDSHYSRCLPK